MMEHADKYIIDGFRSFDPAITKEYFYGYCRRAYNIYDYKYQLRNKTGLDFYSLAHEYYIHLLKFKFKPLLDKPKEMKLSTWMAKGFHFVVLDALKAYNKEFEHKAEEAADVVLEYVRSTDKEEGMLSYVAEAVAAHYHDRIMHEIAFMIFRAGFKQKEVAAQLGMTPAAVNQRYKKMMEEVVTPFVIENYGSGLYTGNVMLACMRSSDILLWQKINHIWTTSVLLLLLYLPSNQTRYLFSVQTFKVFTQVVQHVWLTRTSVLSWVTVSVFRDSRMPFLPCKVA